jgi:hypothetical protein
VRGERVLAKDMRFVSTKFLVAIHVHVTAPSTPLRASFFL